LIILLSLAGALDLKHTKLTPSAVGVPEDTAALFQVSYQGAVFLPKHQQMLLKPPTR
jgi:hypothetical protein